MKKNKKMMVVFLTPALLIFSIVFIYPVIRTVLMSFFAVERPSTAISDWEFTGPGNYLNVFSKNTFWRSMRNLLTIWGVGGIATMLLSLLFAVILTSGIRFKSFFRAMIYMPNVVSAVALAAMWMYYVFSERYGLLHNFFGALGLTSLSKIKWLGTDMKLWAMIIAFVFGAVGYYMLIWISGIEKIPQDLFEAATIDGAGRIKQFRYITLPLLKGTLKMNLTFWSVNAVAFFVWSKMFSPVTSENSTVVPMIYMYDLVFGSKTITETDAGAGAAIGCILALCVLVIFFLMNHLIKDDDLEY
ncbi:MAG: sugar ABC transporter permease [Lachnospiraceae bacterium]|nr:sugar ABC transporter permease [Lachnospiraceae bacterium]